jgi:hypothetical protein
MSDSESTGGPIFIDTKVTIVIGLAAGLFLLTLILFGLAAVTIFFPECSVTQSILSLLQSSGAKQSAQSSTPSARAFLIDTAGTFGGLALSLALFGAYISQNVIMQNQEETQTKQLETMENQVETHSEQIDIMEDQVETQTQQLQAMEDQVETQTKQVKSMRQETMPFLGVHGDGVELRDFKPEVENPDSNPLDVTDGDEGTWVSVGVENLGAQIAHQVHMACLIDFPDLEDEPPFLPGVCAMESTKTVTDSPVGKGALVSAASGLMLLRGTPYFCEDTEHGPQKAVFLPNLITQLREKERKVRFGFVLIYTNSMEQYFKTTLNSWTAKPENFERYDLSDIFANTLIQHSSSYPTDHLIEDIAWEIPTETFESFEE